MNLKLFLDLIRRPLLFFIIFSIIVLLFNICFPQEVFAMDPNIVIDYYGDKEYVGTDPYGHNNDPVKISTTPAIITSPCVIQSPQNDSYATSAPYEKDWYANNDPHILQSPIGKDNSIYTIYMSLKRRTFWYVWKIHSDDYRNYKDFKSTWDPRNSIRKEILKDIKSEFNNFTKK